MGTTSVNSTVTSRGRAVSRPVAVIPPPSQSIGKRLGVFSKKISLTTIFVLKHFKLKLIFKFLYFSPKKSYAFDIV